MIWILLSSSNRRLFQFLPSSMVKLVQYLTIKASSRKNFEFKAELIAETKFLNVKDQF